MAGALRLTAPIPGGLWEPVRGLLPAQAAFSYRRALNGDPREPTAVRSLSQAFQALGFSDAQRFLDAAARGLRDPDALMDGGARTGAADQSLPRAQADDELLTRLQADGAEGLSRAVSGLLLDGRAEAAVRLFAAAENRRIRADRATRDRVATTLLYLGRPSEARGIWERTVDPPSQAARLAHIAASELAELDFTAAERSYQASLALDPNLGETWLGLALLHTERGDAAETLKASREGLRRTLTPEQRSFLRFVEALAAPYAPDSPQ